jgi:hypothetical protein
MLGLVLDYQKIMLIEVKGIYYLNHIVYQDLDPLAHQKNKVE